MGKYTMATATAATVDVTPMAILSFFKRRFLRENHSTDPLARWLATMGAESMNCVTQRRRACAHDSRVHDRPGMDIGTAGMVPSLAAERSPPFCSQHFILMRGLGNELRLQTILCKATDVRSGSVRWPQL